ncbi:MAG: creatininase family protein [Candidatus Eremiobacterota bacterium]
MAVHCMQDLPWGRLRRLAHGGAMFLLPLGPLEDHGAHLPAGVDWFLTEGFTRDMARLLSERRPDLEVVLVPTLAVGASLMHNLGCIRMGSGVLKRALVDMGIALEREGVRRLVLISTHGAMSQAYALNGVCRILTRRGRMQAIAPCMRLINRFLQGEFRGDLESRLGRAFTQEEWNSLRFDVHAGAWETALMLKYRPELVASFYSELPPHVPERLGLGVLRKLRTHRGYFGAPGLATPELGEALAAVLAEQGARALLEFADAPLPHRAPLASNPGKTAVVATGLGLAMAVTWVWLASGGHQRNPPVETRSGAVQPRA